MGVKARRHKVEIMEQVQSITGVAGVDIGKLWLDVDVCEASHHQRFHHTPEGLAQMVVWLRDQGVHRVGMEASGQYERDVREALEASGFEAIVLQPLEVRAFARYRRIRLKSDKADAHLIAKATAAYEGVVARFDPYLVDLAELMTAYEQTSQLLAQVRTLCEHHRLEVIKAMDSERILYLEAQKVRLRQLILEAIRAHPDLKARFQLLKSLPGVGDITAMSLVIRMPELGRMAPGKPAALLGVAPFDRDSGQFHGKRFITGGRSRPRTFVYLAALSAKRMNSGFKAFAQRLLDGGKPKKVVIVAIMRKLIEAANIVLKRKTPWIKYA